MTKIIMAGSSGAMGKAVSTCAAKRDDCEIVAGIDLKATDNGYPVYNSIADFNGEADVIIDFSHPSLLTSLLDYAKAHKTPAVICTTGLSEQQVAEVKEASKIVPIFYSGNMSLGVNLLINLSKKAAEVLGDSFDIEIVEKHHNQKLDAPSGTALMIANAINETLDNRCDYEYDRHSKRAKRPKNEIGIHAVRGGTIVGEHEVMFAGHDEIITISHSARSKEVFAAGSVNAAIFLKTQAPDFTICPIY